jgi:hypothetical protein
LKQLAGDPDETAHELSSPGRDDWFGVGVADPYAEGQVAGSESLKPVTGFHIVKSITNAMEPTEIPPDWTIDSAGCDNCVRKLGLWRQRSACP